MTEPEEMEITEESTPLERFLHFLTSEGITLPDKMPKSFKKTLGVEFDAAYSRGRCCLSFSPVDSEVLGNMEEIGWTLLDLSDESEWPEVLQQYPEIFLKA
jgi:hypothetical protein